MAAIETPIIADEGAQYYANAAVQTRILEYCGGASASSLTCAYVSQLAPGGHATWNHARRVNPNDIRQLLADGWDLSRAALDRESLIVHFEIDVSDPDAPADALLRPAQAFYDAEPAYSAVRAELRQLQLPMIDIMSGRGYHFAGRLPLTSPTVERISSLAPDAGTRADRTHVALGMLLEHLGHRVHQRVAPAGVPIVFNGVEVGRGGVGREAISIDLSAYGDSVEQRQMRVAFSTYQSHRIRPDIFGPRANRDVPILVAVPRRGRSLMWMLEHARTTKDAAALARTEHADLPDVTEGVNNLVDAYEASPLRRVHHAFYSDSPHPPPTWPDTYDRLSRDNLLPCLAHALRFPNDALLKPTVLQHLTRFLLSQDWAPRHIAGLVWSKYARDFAWGDQWATRDPQRRAEFDVRVFSDAVLIGLDQAIDFNCVSSQEKGLCPRTGCAHDLRDDRARLLRRVAR